MSNEITYQDMPEVQKNKWIIFASIILFTFMATLDGSIVNVALPVISKDLGVKMNQSIWVVAIYMITICCFLLFFGKIGDSYGKIKVFKIGLVVFLSGSLLSGFSTSLEFLVFSRVVQAIGASMTMSTNLGIISEIFSSQDRAKALGFTVSVVSLGNIAGPSVGGFVVEYFSWSFIFWINIPIGIITLLLGSKYLPQDLVKTKTKIDSVGFFIYVFFITTFFGSIFMGQEVGFDKIYIQLFLIVGLLTLFAFIVFESKIKNPLLNLSIFKIPSISIGLFISFIVFSTNFFLAVLMPFYLQSARGFSASYAGLLMMILPVVMVFASAISGLLVHKLGARKMMIVGLGVLSCSHISLAFIKIDTPIFLFALSVGLIGLGNAMFQPANNTIIMGSAAKKELGIVGSLASVFRNFGNIVGIALSTTTLFVAMSYMHGQKVTSYLVGEENIFIYGMNMAFFVSSVMMLTALVITVFLALRK